ncbi:MAG: hypothetical protein SNJ77_04910, partial [Cytophagales bacterium]
MMKKSITMMMAMGICLATKAQNLVKLKDGRGFEGKVKEVVINEKVKILVDSVEVLIPYEQIESMEMQTRSLAESKTTHSFTEEEVNILRELVARKLGKFDYGVSKFRGSGYVGFVSSYVFALNGKAIYGLTKYLSAGLEAELINARFYRDQIYNGEQKLGDTKMGGYTQMPLCVIGKFHFSKQKVSP